jgi:hypothetical protein
MFNTLSKLCMVSVLLTGWDGVREVLITHAAQTAQTLNSCTHWSFNAIKRLFTWGCTIPHISLFEWGEGHIGCQVGGPSAMRWEQWGLSATKFKHTFLTLWKMQMQWFSHYHFLFHALKSILSEFRCPKFGSQHNREIITSMGGRNE